MIRAYRLLLRLFPAPFRREYGGEMLGVFRDDLRAAGSAWRRLAVFARAATDILRHAPVVHGEMLGRDLRDSLRALRHAPAFALTAIAIAALGIGAATATASLADHVLLRPLPFDSPDRLVKLWQDHSRRNSTSRLEPSPANYRDWQAMSRAFSAMEAYALTTVNLTGGVGEPLRLEAAAMTAGLPATLGVRPVIGRAFAEDGRDETGPTVLLSHGLWTQRFGRDPRVLGTTLRLNGIAHEVIGVMPAAFTFPARTTRLWTALRFEPQDFDERDNTYLHVIARLREGVSREQAQADMTAIGARLASMYPDTNERTGVTVALLRDQVTGRSRQLLIALMAGGACVLLIAITNLANLLIARALARRQEIALRMALGAGRDRLVRQLATESGLLAAAGGVAGIGVALLALPVISLLVPNTMPIAELPALDLRLLAVAFTLTAITGAGVGVLPAVRASRAAPVQALGDSARSGWSRQTERLRGLLVVAEVAASVLLLVAAGLLVRSLWRIQQIDPGFRTDHILTLRTPLPLPQYAPVPVREQFYARVLDDVRALPGVGGAAYISFLPMVMRGGIWPVGVGGQPPESPDATTVSLRYVTPGFFALLDIPLREGRDVRANDAREAEFVAVVSESFARKHWPGESALGRRLTVAFFERTVVGVVGDIRVRGLEQDSEPQVYLPSAQVPDGGLPFYVPKDLVVRTAGDPVVVAPAVRQAIARADPQLPITDVRTLAEIVEADSAPRAVQVRVLGAFAAMALVLAAVGLHGVLAYTVTSRRREIGVRRALGATIPHVVGEVVARGVRLALLGVLVGTAVAAAGAGWLRSLLVGVESTDVLVFAMAGGLCVAVSVVGSLLPALRAARVDPLAALR